MELFVFGQLGVVILFFVAVITSTIVLAPSFLRDGGAQFFSPSTRNDLKHLCNREWGQLWRGYMERQYGGSVCEEIVPVQEQEIKKAKSAFTPTTNPKQSTDWVRKLSSVPVLFIYGRMGSGKTTVVHTLIKTVLDRDDNAQICIIAPKPEKRSKGLWWGLPVVTVGRDVSYDDIKKTILAITKETCRRQGDIERDYPLLYIVIDDIPDVSRNCKSGELTDMINKVCTVGRTLSIQLVLISQSNRVAQTGFTGLNDILLDTPTVFLKDQKGTLIEDKELVLLDMSCIRDIRTLTSGTSYGKERLWSIPREDDLQPRLM